MWELEFWMVLNGLAVGRLKTSTVNWERAYAQIRHLLFSSMTLWKRRCMLWFIQGCQLSLILQKVPWKYTNLKVCPYYVECNSKYLPDCCTKSPWLQDAIAGSSVCYTWVQKGNLNKDQSISFHALSFIITLMSRLIIKLTVLMFEVPRYPTRLSTKSISYCPDCVFLFIDCIQV